jgi:hypothetical protein
MIDDKDTDKGDDMNDEFTDVVVEEMTLERYREAYHIACENIVRLNDKCSQFTEALQKALALQDALLSEMGVMQRELGHPPSIQLMVAKANFDTAMKVLLGDQ